MSLLRTAARRFDKSDAGSRTATLVFRDYDGARQHSSSYENYTRRGYYRDEPHHPIKLVAENERASSAVGIITE